jgi:ABC-2 type transport system permease protein
MKIFVYSVFVLIHREWKRFFRQRSRVYSSILTPLLIWFLMGMGFGKSFQMPFSDAGYLEYFFPGILMMTLLFSAIFSMISLIEDRNEGFLQSVLVSPVSHNSVVLGKILGAASLSTAQTLLILPFAYFAGITISSSVVLQLTIIFMLSAVFMCALSFFFAWILNSSQGFHAVMNIVLFPMWILSGAMFPIQNSSVWLQFLMKLNPLTYAVDAVRRTIYSDLGFVTMFSDFGLQFDLVIICFFCLFFVLFSLHSVKKSYLA